VIAVLAMTAWVAAASQPARADSQVHASSPTRIVVSGLAPHFELKRAVVEVRPFGQRWQPIRVVRLRKRGRFHLVWFEPALFEGGWLRLIVRRPLHSIAVVWERELGPNLIPAPDMLRDYHLHIFFWTPPGTALQEDVVSGIPRFENDIQASLASGALSNIFAIPRSYSGPDGPGDPRIASIDVSGRSDPVPEAPIVEGSCAGVTVPCATSAQIATEVEAVAHAEQWSRGGEDLILMYTGSPLAVCLKTNCALSTEPCGYHSITELGRAYATVIMSAAENSQCASAGPPDLEFARQLTGHEQNEAVVDPGIEGIEIADPCQGHFLIQLINGTRYVVPDVAAQRCLRFFR
jgi:hypothetical protein